MRLNRTTGVVLLRAGLVGVLLGGVSAGVSGEGVLLAPRFVPGERVRYRLHLTVETESTLSPLQRPDSGEEGLRLAFDLTWQVEALAVEPTGAVSLRAAIESLQIESSPAGAWTGATEKYVGRVVTYKLLNDGTVEDIQAPEEWLEDGELPSWLRTWLQQGSGASAGLPPNPVVPGQQWSAEREFEVAGLPRQHLVSESTYVRDKQVGQTPCAVILTRFELTGADSHEEKTPGSGRATVERRVQGDGNRLSCYDHGSGRLLESSQTSREYIRLEIRQRLQRAAEQPPPVVVESRTSTESHLRVVN